MQQFQHIFDPDAPTFGLPSCLRIPIAAASIDAIAKYVGIVLEEIIGRSGRVNAVSVRPHQSGAVRDPRVKLWTHPQADAFALQLHPARQVCVHVDYSRYRQAYKRLSTVPIPSEYVLDHVQNREAIRLRGYSHPYLRLCPVSRRVNSSGGSNYGGEGMEKEHLRSLANLPAMKNRIIYADPMDITKMLDISPGTEVLAGVGETLRLLYPE